MAKVAKTGDLKKAMDTTKSTVCPMCSKPTRIVKRVKDRERGTPGPGVYISCSACDFFEKLPIALAAFTPKAPRQACLLLPLIRFFPVPNGGYFEPPICPPSTTLSY